MDTSLPGGTVGPRVLVIEDDHDVLALLGSHLRRLGCEVTLVDTGEAGLGLARQVVPDLVLVDMLLPGIDGREVISALRADARTRSCRIVVTSVLDPGDFDDVVPDAVLPKPFSRSQLARVLISLGPSKGEAWGSPA